MKKGYLAALLVITAAASSAATIGVQKLVSTMGSPADVVILTDARCKDCDTARLEAVLKSSFPDSRIKTVDYGERRGKALHQSESVGNLPAVLIPSSYSEQESFKRFQQFAKLGKDYYLLATGGSFDPTAEICDNGIDDNGNGLIDCEDPSCKNHVACMETRDRPEVEVFVMSYCPFGIQIEKGLLPVWDLMGDKIDLELRFVGYAMKGKKEIDEQLKQYCVGVQGKDKLRKYLECFLKDGDTAGTCAKDSGVDDGRLAACIKRSDIEFGVTVQYEDKSKWMGRFPPFPLHADLADRYGVRGSPAVVINGVMVQSGRSPKALLASICKAFKTPPPECEADLDDATPSPSFGFTKAASPGGADAACGG